MLITCRAITNQQATKTVLSMYCLLAGNCWNRRLFPTKQSNVSITSIAVIITVICVRMQYHQHIAMWIHVNNRTICKKRQGVKSGSLISILYITSYKQPVHLLIIIIIISIGLQNAINYSPKYSFVELCGEVLSSLLSSCSRMCLELKLNNSEAFADCNEWWTWWRYLEEKCRKQ